MHEILNKVLIAAVWLAMALMPFVYPRIKSKAIAFNAVFFLIYLSQIFMYNPGTDVSPNAYTLGPLRPIEVLGLTSSSWTNLLMMEFCLVRFFYDRHKRIEKWDIISIAALAVYSVVGMITANGFFSALGFLTQILMPFFVYYSLKLSRRERRDEASFESLVLAVNLFAVGQVLFCKLVYGSFGVNKFYYELTQEYFGMWNHAHSFAGLMGLLALWSIRQILHKKMPILNLVLLVSNLLLMYLTQVRTYVLAAGIAIALVVLSAFISPALKRYRKLALACLALALAATPFVIMSLATTRQVGDVSSGRFERWIMDVDYFLKNTPAIAKLFGSGFMASHEVNRVLFDVSINSLNFVIDLLIDNGLLGLIVISFVYIRIFRTRLWFQTSDSVMSLALTTYIAIGAVVTNVLPYVTITPLACAMVFFLNNKFEANQQADGVEVVPGPSGEGTSGSHALPAWCNVRQFLRRGFSRQDRA